MRGGISTGTLIQRAALWLRLAFAGLALTALAACADTLDTRVTRFQSALPAPAGQSFAILPDDPAMAGGIEFGEYANGVAAHLARLGYVPASSPDTANLIVHFGYGVDKGREHVESNGFYDPFWGPWHGYRGFGGAYYGGGFGGFGGYYGRGFIGHGAWGYGWYDPWFGGESYTIYTSGITMKIDSHDGKRLFEGRATAASTSNHLPYLVPNLTEALFTGFPGNSGETVRITVAPEKMAHH